MQADISTPSIWQPWAAWQHLPGHHTPPREQSLAAPQHVPAAFCYKVMTAKCLSLSVRFGHLLRSGVKPPPSTARLPSTAQLTGLHYGMAVFLQAIAS